jgi:ABC-type phosphate/phosphonate transport system substrate-binding protein
MRKLLTRFMGCAILVMTFQSHSQTINLTVEAIYPPQQAEFVYQPLADWLASKTGFDVEIESADNYYFYWRDAKSQNPDFTLDAPHVAAYRMAEKNYQPILRVAADQRYYLVTNQNIDVSEDIGKQLVGKRVITFPSPNIGSLLYTQWFTDLFLQPQKVVTALSWKDVINQVFSGEAEAAIIPQYLYQLYPNLLVLKESDPYPGQIFLASPTVSPNIKSAVIKALSEINDSDEAYQILTELNAERLTEVNIEDYQGLEKLLEN